MMNASIRLKRWASGLALSLVFSASLLGCSTTVRSVTHVGAYGPTEKPYLYIGYAENKDVSKVRRCAINPDNSITCDEEAAVNRLLNPED